MSAINWPLIKNPINWLIVFLMIVFAALVAENLCALVHGPCGCNKSEK